MTEEKAKEEIKELIKNRELVLVNPEKWDDPFENFFLKGNAVDNNGNNVDFSNLREMWYGQCWTKNEDTDALAKGIIQALKGKKTVCPQALLSRAEIFVTKKAVDSWESVLRSFE